MAVFAQWLIYDDWLHDRGPLRIFGSILAGALTFAFSYRVQELTRERQIEKLRRAEAMRTAHDRVRNSLQTIECVTYAHNPETTEPVRNAVDQIEKILDEAIVGSGDSLPPKILNTMRRSGPEEPKRRLNA